MSWIWMILIGAAAGWLAGKVTRGDGFGFVVNALLGIVGSVIGAWAFGKLGIQTGGLIGTLASATTGAILLIGIANFFGLRGR